MGSPSDHAGHGTDACAAAADALLAQAQGLIEGLDDSAYTYSSPVMMRGTIGKHVRHCLDHFSAALGVIEAGGVIDYDHRERNVPMETSRDEALKVIAGLRSALARVDRAAALREVEVRVMLTAAGDEATLRSTLARELAFAAHHAQHHHAMMQVIADELGAATPDGFGKAPSTLNHERGGASVEVKSSGAGATARN